jgi:DUF1365 family protein
MNSCLYECSVMHQRLAPKQYCFTHDIFMFYLDLDELDSVARNTFLFSRNRRNFYVFRDGDHLPPGGASLKENVLAYLARNGVDLGSNARIMLLTLPRVLGYIFNPVSFYFCFDAAGAPVCAIAEVGNTFREMKLFLLRREEMSGNDAFHKVTPKHFYVSPFSSLELSFDFKLKIPGEALGIHIDDRDGGDKVLLSTLSGKRAALTNGRLSWFTLKYPLLTLKVIFLIHWHALILYLKKVPFYRKAANPSLQSEVLNPHATLTGRAK